MRSGSPLSLLFTVAYIGVAVLIGWLAHSKGAFAIALAVGLVVKYGLRFVSRR